jgi:hypothetical protein
MGVTVRRRTSQLDRWDALSGDTRWVDYSHQHDGDDLIVYLHTFRRTRERADQANDMLWWKPATTVVAHRYAADDWAEVVRAEREWPPTEVEFVPRRLGTARHGLGPRRHRRP